MARHNAGLFLGLVSFCIIGVAAAAPARDGDPVAMPVAAETVRADALSGSRIATLAATKIDPSCAGLSEPIQLSAAGGYLPDMAIDHFGRTHVVWSGDDFFVWYAQVGPEGTITIPAVKVYDNARTTFPRIAVDSAGDAHIITTSSSSSVPIYLKIHNGTRVLLTVFTIFTPTGLYTEQAFWPSIAVDTVTNLPVIAAEVHASITVSIGGFPITRYDNYISVLTLDKIGNPIRSSRWDAYSLLGTSSSSDRAQKPNVAVDSLGRSHAVWLHRDPAWAGYSVGYANQAGSSWVEIANTRNVAGLSLGPPNIAISSNHLIEVVWATGHQKVVWQEMSREGLPKGANLIVSQPAARASRPKIAAGYGNVFFG